MDPRNYIDIYNEHLIIDSLFFFTIDFSQNNNLKYLEVRNCRSLLSIKVRSNSNLKVIIQNCPKLKDIITTNNNEYCGELLYIGEGVNQLTGIYIYNFREIVIIEKPESFKYCHVSHIDKLNFNFKDFVNLEEITVNYCKVDRIDSMSDRLLLFNISNSNIDTINIEGKSEVVVYFRIKNTLFSLLSVNCIFKMIETLHLDNNSGIFPLITLPKQDNRIRLYLNPETYYHISMMEFIKQSNVTLYDVKKNKITIDCLKFYPV